MQLVPDNIPTNFSATRQVYEKTQIPYTNYTGHWAQGRQDIRCTTEITQLLHASILVSTFYKEPTRVSGIQGYT